MKTEKVLKWLHAIISSETRTKIIDVLQESKKPLSISEINRKMSSYNYRTIWQHIKVLEDVGIIKKKKEQHKKGKPAIIILAPISQRKKYFQALKEFSYLPIIKK